MAESTPTYVSELVKQMKRITPDTDEDTLHDLADENVVDVAAEILTYKQVNNCSVPIW